MTYTDEGYLHPIGATARQFGVSLDTIRRWEKEGKISAIRTVGGQRRFAQSEIDRVLAESQTDSAPAA